GRFSPFALAPLLAAVTARLSAGPCRRLAIVSGFRGGQRTPVSGSYRSRESFTKDCWIFESAAVAILSWMPRATPRGALAVPARSDGSDATTRRRSLRLP